MDAALPMSRVRRPPLRNFAFSTVQKAVSWRVAGESSCAVRERMQRDRSLFGRRECAELESGMVLGNRALLLRAAQDALPGSHQSWRHHGEAARRIRAS